jgi:hypothetical protein
MSYQDAIDLLTPLVLIPLYWFLFRFASERATGLGEEIAFLALAVFWVQGQGMHLSANSISNLIENLAKNGVIDVTGSDIFTLTYFYDELLSHYLWHIGILGLIVVLIHREWRQPAGEATLWWATLTGGVLYGLILFLITLEGQTTPLALPFIILFALFGLAGGRRKLGQQPLLAFFCVACLVAALVYLAWGLIWGGFPQLTEVGLI